ncbi:MAG: DUF6786 family protein [Chitinophagaceae bacterium]
MPKYCITQIILILMVISSCNEQATQKDQNISLSQYEKGTYGYDLQFLQQYDSLVVLKDESGNAQVIVSPKYQAKVFTSTATGLSGNSFGWINYKAFAAPVDEHMNAFGGENRFWLGPEGGVFSLYFKKGDSMVFDNWRTPPPIDTEAWDVTSKDSQEVSMQKQMQLTNYKGFLLQLLAKRKVFILNTTAIFSKLSVPLDTSLKAVGYETQNSIINTGSHSWNESTGMPCIWILDMFTPSPQTVIAIPYKADLKNEFSKIATTDYFGEIPDDRIKYIKDVLLFKADGKSRGKLGISPGRAKPLAGSYDGQTNVLTITLFDINPDALYLNQEWSTNKLAFSGDAVNAYNDGPLQDGSQMGPFYEIESVSPAAFLKPMDSLSHNHTVIHLIGNINNLNNVALKVFGISLQEMQQAFKLSK